MAEAEPMPITALTRYLRAKHEHETVRDNYFADMARYAAWAHVKDGPKVLPRYWDIWHKDGKAARAEDYDERDVVDMFKGRGKLVR